MSTQAKSDDNKMVKDSVVPQSYKGMTLEEARVFLRNTMDLFQSLSSMADLKTMYEAGKQLSRLYFDCANHQRELAEILLELEFPEYTIKTMKKLNNMGVFKNDDIWFSSFYFYNICWNYSDASFEFATALALCGLPNLLNLNIGHKPYLDNLSSRNVYYLIKASLSIIHNICRFPGSCIYFRSESVKSSLLNLINREEDFIRVVASLCLASIVAENEPHLLRGDDSEDRPDVMHSIIGYIRKARHSERGRFMGFRSYELLQGIRSATTVECEKRHFLELDGLTLLKESLVGGKVVMVEDDVAECLDILCNLSVSRELQPRLIESGLDGAVIGPAFASHDNARIRAAAHDFLWSLEPADQAAAGATVDSQDELADAAAGKPLPVYVSYATINRFSVVKIRDRLADTNLVRFIEPDVRPDGRVTDDAVRKAIAKSALVILCVSEAFKSHPHFQLEVELCERMRKPLVPLLIQQKYRPDGWLQRALDRDLTVFDLSSKRDFETSWDTFVASIGARLKDIRHEWVQRQQQQQVAAAAVAAVADMRSAVKHEKVDSGSGHHGPPHHGGGHHDDGYRNSIEDMSRSQHHLVEPLPTLCDGGTAGGHGYRRYNGAENNVDAPSATGLPAPPSASITPGTKQHHQQQPIVDVLPLSGAGETYERSGPTGTSGSGAPTLTVNAWLDRHDLAHLRPQLAWANNSIHVLRCYQAVKKCAPEYFHHTLEHQLKLDLIDVLRFSDAIDHL